MLNGNLIDIALGAKPADLIIKNGYLVNVHSKEIYKSDVAIGDDKIAAIGDVSHCSGPATEVIDASEQYLLPGFIDAHIHFESSMLSFSEFAKAVLKRGTTLVASDLMEVTIVSGIEGAKEILDEAKKTPVTLRYMVPSFMDESEFQTIGSTLSSELVEELIALPEAVGIAEVLAHPILGKSPASAKMISLAEKEKKTAEGHAPALNEKMLNAYCTAGINSEHEGVNANDALERLRRGLRVLMREGSASTDLLPCIKILTETNVDSRHCAMVSDDIDALHISECGHMDHKIRMAINAGVDPLTAIQMVTLNPAESLKIDDLFGSIAPGKYANIVIVDDLPLVKIDKVIAQGQLVYKGSQLIAEINAPRYSERLLDTVKLKAKIVPDDLSISVEGSFKKAKVRVIGASATSLLKESLEAELPVIKGKIASDPDKDILLIATVERYGKNGNIGKGFIKGFGLQKGAIATSVGHDHHNITVLGANTEDMALAVNRVAELTGGLVVAVDGEVVGELALPLCGLLSMDNVDEVASKIDQLQKVLRQLGCPMVSPFMSLSFITLIFIPAYGISDLGLINVYDMEIVNPILELK